MFDAVRNNKKVVQVFLAMITLPFAFWGVDSYMRNSAGDSTVASFAGMQINQQQFHNALREQQEKLREKLGPRYDAKLFDTLEARQAVLDNLIDQRLLLVEASKTNLTAGDEALRQVIAAIPDLQENGKFSMARYEAALRAQGLTQAGFEAQVRQDLTLQQLVGAVGGGSIRARTALGQLIALQTEERKAVDFHFSPEAYLVQVKLEADAARKYYDANPKLFEVPEQLKAEFLVLGMEAIMAQVTVPEAEIRAAYEKAKERYQQGEERRASHILITADEKAPEAERKAAKTKAEQLLGELRKNPKAFADLAKKNSQDPGSAAKGGDLGFFSRGMMVESFDKAAFSLKEGELSDVVQSDFGYHIILVTGIKAAKGKPYEEVKPGLTAELKRQAAQRKYAEMAEAFTNTIYEQSDSLGPAAEKFKLTVQKSDWLLRQGGRNAGVLANEKVLAALFSEDAIKNRRNTETVEVSPNTLVAARVAEHKPAVLQPFETVKADIENRLKREEAHVLAKKAGEAKLEALRKGGNEAVTWGPVRNLSRSGPSQMPPQVVEALFKVPADKLPAYTGVELPKFGYVLLKLQAVEAGKVDEQRRKGMEQQLQNLLSQEEAKLYVKALRERYKVEINKAALESKEK